MAKSSLTWISPPSDIAATLASRTAGMEGSLNGLAQNHAARGENRMKARAGWNDRTGHARGSLYGRAEGTDIVLGTTNAEYGIFLELGTYKMRAYPTIEPTAYEAAPDYFTDAGDLVQRLLGGGG